MGLFPFLFMANQVLLLLFTTYPQQATSTPHNNYTDLETLLAFKAHFSDPYGILAANWTTNTSFCSWTGVTCNHWHQRVASLNLFSIPLQGTILPHLANLSFLSSLDLSNTSLTGPIPQTLGHLSRLTVLSLETNSLTGHIPLNIFNISSLTRITLGENNLTGSLPTNYSFNMISRLQIISLSLNQLTGTIPLSFSQCSDLQVLSLSSNAFTGTLPIELGNLPQLTLLYLGQNLLTGMIPTSLGNLTNLNEMDLSLNNFKGVIPKALGSIPNLQYLNLGYNGLTGSMPILNASMLNHLYLASNNLTGSVPVMLGEYMPLLTDLNIADNQLSGGLDFISSLSNCRNLQAFKAWNNKLKGALPDSVGNLSSQLQDFHAYGNLINGKIPAHIGNLSNLILLDLGKNELTGEMPSALGRLKKLQVIYLMINRIEGSIPFELGLLTNLNTLHLQKNQLSGEIPSSLGNISRLQLLSVATNKLSSSIPQSLWSLSDILELNLHQNTLEGSLPQQFSKLKSLDTFDLSNNRFSGNISSALGELQMLRYMDFSSNSFHGQIPQSLGNLINLEYLNLSGNSISGVIPNSLANFHHLTSLDLSFNRLEGQIPEGRVFSNLTIPSLQGNEALCGAPQLGFPPCTENNAKGRGLLKYILPATASAMFLVVCFILLYVALRRKKADAPAHNDAPQANNYRFISYREIVRATNNFNEANFLGRGSFSSVFKGCLDDGLLVAIKVLNLEIEGASRSFDVECHALSMVRHRNLVKIISTCSNSDFKSLVLQYIPNESLEKWLYSQNYRLNLLQRINIMVDVSLALEYLHHQHPHVIVHCDLKPSNVFLDENMTAHVGDFGIAKLLHADRSRSLTSRGAPGTIGYMAPEYGSTGTVSIKGDVYSFGILLLETFTGKRPTDVMFNAELSLRQWVSKEHPASILRIVDCNLLTTNSINGPQSEELTVMLECLSSILDLGLLCSRDSPKERILMKDVVPILQRVKMEYLSKLQMLEQSTML